MYSQLSPNGPLYKMDTSLRWTHGVSPYSCFPFILL